MRSTVRWLFRIGGLLLALVVYAIWRQLDAQLGYGFPSGFLRGALIFGLIIWLWYATAAPKKPPAMIAKPTSPDMTSVGTEPTDKTPNDAPSDQHWAQALAELEGGSRKPGVWARAFAEAQGNESLAQANYLSARARQLADEQREKLAKEKEAEEQAKRDAEIAHMAEQQRQYDLLPKGRCPNCEAVILMSARECPKCHAAFSAGSAWKVFPIKEQEQRQNETPVQTGVIGGLGGRAYSMFQDGSVEIETSWGGKRRFPSLEEARKYIGA